MNTVRYILCGAATCYLFLGVTGGLLLAATGVMGLMLIPASLIVGALCGYLYAKTKRSRDSRFVHVLPERTQDSTHATAA